MYQIYVDVSVETAHKVTHPLLENYFIILHCYE